MDPKTVSAIKDFQSSNGLTSDGVFGNATATLLLSVATYDKWTDPGGSSIPFFILALSLFSSEREEACP